MLAQQTLEKLGDLRLRGLAQAYQEQLEGHDVSGLSFDDRFGLLVDREWVLRQERRTRSRLVKAKLKHQACREDTDYRHARGLKKAVMLDLYGCQWVRAKRNLILTGPTGIGKTWLACALANAACREGFTAHYARVPRLVHELVLARADGSYLKQLTRLAKTDLLILDDWGLSPLEGEGLHMLLEVVDDRAGIRSTGVTSQLPVEKWHDMMGDPTVADALLDRLLGTAQQIRLKGDSLRRERPSSDEPAPDDN